MFLLSGYVSDQKDGKKEKPGRTAPLTGTNPAAPTRVHVCFSFVNLVSTDYTDWWCSQFIRLQVHLRRARIYDTGFEKCFAKQKWVWSWPGHCHFNTSFVGVSEIWLVVWLVLHQNIYNLILWLSLRCFQLGGVPQRNIISSSSIKLFSSGTFS